MSMTTRQYGDITVHGGHVHAGDTILNFNIGIELTETAQSCRVLDIALSNVCDGPTYLGDLRSDIDELLNAISTIQTCIEENSTSEILMSTKAQSNLLDLWLACKTQKQTLATFETLLTIPGSESPSSHVFAALRGALRGLRRRLNTSIAILHLSTLQELRSVSEQHWPQLRRQVENLQEQQETMILTQLPAPLPISRMNLSRLPLPETPADGIRRLLHSGSTSLKSNGPSMRFSHDYSSSLEYSVTFVSAVEYHLIAGDGPTSFLSKPLVTNSPVQAFLSNKTRTKALPEVTGFQAKTRTSASWRRRHWNSPCGAASTYKPRSDDLSLLQRRLYDQGYSLLQTESECQYREECVNSNRVIRHLHERVENNMLSVFAENSEMNGRGQQIDGLTRKPRIVLTNPDRNQSTICNQQRCEAIEPGHSEWSLQNVRVTLLLDDRDLRVIDRYEKWPMKGIALVYGEAVMNAPHVLDVTTTTTFLK